MKDMYNNCRSATLLEMPMPDILRKQASVYKLFPPFDDRVDAVAAAGGVKLHSEDRGVWNFKIKSGTEKGKQYDAHIEFADLEKQIEDNVKDPRLWKKDMSGVDLRKLVSEIFDEIDMKVSCSCPAFLYWGQKYILTKRRSVYKGAEYRRPKIRNPKEYGSLCKHLQLLFDVLPMYRSTLAGHIKRYYSDTVKKAEDAAREERKLYKKGTEFLAKRQKARESVEEIDFSKIADAVPDVNDPRKINYWLQVAGHRIYVEGWSDQCLAGTGLPTMEEGSYADKLSYIEDLTPGILAKKARERGLKLISGKFIETSDKKNLYGVTIGVYARD